MKGDAIVSIVCCRYNCLCVASCALVIFLVIQKNINNNERRYALKMSLQNPIHSEMYKHPNNSIAHSPAHQGGYLHIYQPSNSTPPDAKKKATFFKAYQGTTFHHDYFDVKEAIVDYSPIASPKPSATAALNADDDDFIKQQQEPAAPENAEEDGDEKQVVTPLPKKRMFMISLVCLYGVQFYNFTGYHGRCVWLFTHDTLFAIHDQGNEGCQNGATNRLFCWNFGFCSFVCAIDFGCNMGEN